MTNTAKFRTISVLFKSAKLFKLYTNQVLIRTNPVVFKTTRIIFKTNQIMFRINTFIFRKIKSYLGQIQL